MVSIEQHRLSFQAIVYDIAILSVPTHLIRRVTDADIKVWKLRLHHVSKNDLQTLLSRSALETFGDFGSHSRIQLHRDDLLGLFENLCSQVTSTGTDFENDLTTENVRRSPSVVLSIGTHIALLEVGLVDNSVDIELARVHSYQVYRKENLLFSNTGVLQHVLADICVHLEDTVGSLCLCSSILTRIVALSFLNLGHLECVDVQSVPIH